MSDDNLPMMSQSFGDIKFEANKTGDKIKFSIQYDASSEAGKIGFGLYKKAEGSQRDKEGFAILIDLAEGEIYDLFDDGRAIGWIEPVREGQLEISIDVERMGASLLPKLVVGDEEWLYPAARVAPAQNLAGIEYEAKVSFPVGYEAAQLFTKPELAYTPAPDKGMDGGFKRF